LFFRKGALQPRDVKNLGVIAEGSGAGAFIQVKPIKNYCEFIFLFEDS